jgi:hypothetical protein
MSKSNWIGVVESELSELVEAAGFGLLVRQARAEVAA